MENDYKNVISHIDIDRSLGSVEYSEFGGLDTIKQFQSDIGAGNDSIELHLIKSKAYKEMLLLHLKRNDGNSVNTWREFLKEEQKTFGGSKIFYINNDCSKLLVLSVPKEINSKLNMVVTRLNKINERISRINSKIKKENLDLYQVRSRSKDSIKEKEDIVNFINQNLRV